MYDAPMPFGKWTRGHIANDYRWVRRWAPNSLPVILRTYVDFPKLQPDMLAGGQQLFDESTVDAWFKRVDQWVATKDQRDAARKVEAERRFWEAQRAEQRALEINMSGMQQGIEATAQRMEEVKRREAAGIHAPVTSGAR